MPELNAAGNQVPSQNTQNTAGQPLDQRAQSAVQNILEQRAKAGDTQGAQQQMRQQLNSTIQGKDVLETIKNMKAIKKVLDEQSKKLAEQLENDKKDNKLTREQKEEIANQQKYLQEMAVGLSEKGPVVKAIVDSVGKLGSAFSKEIGQVIESNNAYRQIINTRLQGLSDKQDKWTDMVYSVTNNFGTNMLINERKLLENIQTAVQHGIARDIEQRAMLQTLSENIANTFDAFSNELTRFIRLHQYDTTTLALGMESSLTSMLNRLFQDTSYMSDVGTTAVSGALMEAMSQMSPLQATEFNYAIQRVLGSLYSLGMSQSGITNIATALGQLYSGNITAMSPEMTNLMAMSASMSGQPLDTILSKGIDGSNVNALLSSMVNYIADIAEGRSNVVETAFGKVFGLTVSDIKAAANLAPRLAELSAQTLSTGGVSYTDTSNIGMLAQVANMIDTMGLRMGMPVMMDNLLSNFVYSTANLVAGQPASALGYKIINMLGDAIDFAIPSIMAAGFGVSLGDTKVSDIINVAYGAGSIFAGLGTLINSAFHPDNSGLNVGSWWWNTLPKGWAIEGSGFAGISGNLGRSRQLIAGGSMEDIQASEIAEAKSQAMKTQGIDEEEFQKDQEAEKEWKGNVYDKIEDLEKTIGELKDYLFDKAKRQPILVDINSFPVEYESEYGGEKYIRVMDLSADIPSFSDRSSPERGPNRRAAE